MRCLAIGLPLAALLLCTAAVPRNVLAATSPQRQEEQCGWAIYAGLAPWGGPQGVFLFGEEWTPQLVDQAPADIQPGAQGSLCWKPGGGREVSRRMARFNAEEVPLVGDALLEDRDMPWQRHSLLGAVLLLRSLAPSDPRVLGLMKQWRKEKALDSTQWAWALRVCGFAKVLQTEARKDPAATYEQLVFLLQEARWREARALLHGKAGRIDAVAAERHDQSERSCAPVRKTGGGIAPTHMSWAHLLDIAVLYAQGKSKEQEKALRAFARRSPRWRESAFARPGAGPPDHELFLPDRPRAVFERFKGFAGIPADGDG